MRATLILLLSTLLLAVPIGEADPVCGDAIDFGTVQRCVDDADELAREHGIPLIGKACDATHAC